MMNNIYDFNGIDRIGHRLRGYICGYILYSLCIFCLIALDFLFVHNPLLASFIFAIVLLIYILSSVVFLKIKYAILKEHRDFLENMDMGLKKDFLGIFLRKAEQTCENDFAFNNFVFLGANGEVSLSVHKSCSADFTVGEKYHIEQVGNYIYRWGKYENR